MWSTGSIMVGHVNLAVEAPKPTMSDVKDLPAPLSGENGVATETVPPKNSLKSKQTYAETVSNTPPVGGTNSVRLGKANALLGGVVMTLEKGSVYMKQQQIDVITRQASQLAWVIGYLQRAINGEFSDIQFPAELLTNEFVENVAKYMYSGKKTFIIIKINGVEKQVENVSVTEMAKKILLERGKELTQKAIEKVRQKPVADQTQKKNF